MNERLLVLGTGRSGTAYIARLLTQLGYPFGHEDVYDYQDDSGRLERWGELIGDVSLAAWPAIAGLDRRCRVAVVRRQPEKVAQSFLGSYFFADDCACHPPGEHFFSPYHSWMRTVLPSLGDQHTELRRCVTYIAEASDAIEAATLHDNVVASELFHLEDLTRDATVVCRLVHMLTGQRVGEHAAGEAIATVGRANEHPPHPTRVELVPMFDGHQFAKILREARDQGSNP